MSLISFINQWCPGGRCDWDRRRHGRRRSRRRNRRRHGTQTVRRSAGSS